MSTTRLPELPKAAAYATQIKEGRVLFEPRASFNVRGHVSLFSADQMHAYGLAVWKAAIESLIAELGPAAEAHREAAREETDQRCKEWHAATAASYTTVVELARSLPLPEQGGPQ